MSKKKKEKKRKGILKRIWEKMVEDNKGGPTQAGKINLRSQEWPT